MSPSINDIVFVEFSIDDGVVVHEVRSYNSADIEKIAQQNQHYIRAEIRPSSDLVSQDELESYFQMKYWQTVSEDPAGCESLFTP